MKMKSPSIFGMAILFTVAAVFSFCPPLKADVLVLQNGVVITGNILQQDDNGVLLQGEYGTFRYPMTAVKEVRKEAATAPHVSNNGQVIPDWAQIVTLLANSGFAPAIQQVPATVINYGNFKDVPYVSYRCAYGGYEINVFGDLNKPAAIQIGAIGSLKDSAAAKTNCVNFICSVLASADDRKLVRALDWTHKELQKNGGLTFETVLPGEWGSYGGWWISVYDPVALASAQASQAELLTLTQPAPATGTPIPAPNGTNTVPGAAPPVTTTTTYGSDGYYPYYGWTAAELAAAHPATTAPASREVPPTDPGINLPVNSGGMYYPRTYTHEGGTYDVRRR